MQATKTRFSTWFWTGEEPEWIVVITVLVALTLGGVLVLVATGQTAVISVDNLTCKYPANWSLTQDKVLGNIGATDMSSDARISVRVFRKLDPTKPVTLDDLMTMRSFEQAQNLSLYRVLTTRKVAVDGNGSIVLSYAYINEPAKSAYQASLPQVMRGADYLVPYQGQVYLVSYEADASSWQQTVADNIAKSIRLH
jgi:hypothetical protein